MIPRRAKRRDGNEAAIVAALEKVGAFVIRLDEPVDLLVGYRNRWLLLEVKDPKGRNRLEDSQRKFFARLEGTALSAWVVRDELEALTAIGAICPARKGKLEHPQLRAGGPLS